MAEAFPVGAPSHRQVPRARTVLSIGQLVLPSVGLATVGLGLALFLSGSSTVGGYIPLALLAVGTGALITSVVVDPGRPASREISPRAPSRVAAPELSDSYPGKEENAEGAADDRASGATAGSEWRILAAPTEPGDETWLSWLPRESRRLGAVWTATAPRERYSPGHSGRLVAFPAASASVAPRSAARIAHRGELAPSPRPNRFTDDELDRMFPPVGRTTTVFLSEPPDRVGRSQTGTTPMDDSTGPDSEYWDGADYLEHSVPPLGQVASLSAGFVLREDSPATEASASPTPALSAAEPKPMSAPETSSPELALEASNPFPPHMRGSRYHFRELPERSRTSVLDRAAQKTVCASCSKVVVNLRSSSPCPKCLRPVCGGCLREAFVTRGHGWCIDCFDSHEMVPTETAA